MAFVDRRFVADQAAMLAGGRWSYVPEQLYFRVCRAAEPERPSTAVAVPQMIFGAALLIGGAVELWLHRSPWFGAAVVIGVIFLWIGFQNWLRARIPTRVRARVLGWREFAALLSSLEPAQLPFCLLDNSPAERLVDSAAALLVVDSEQLGRVVVANLQEQHSNVSVVCAAVPDSSLSLATTLQQGPLTKQDSASRNVPTTQLRGAPPVAEELDSLVHAVLDASLTRALGAGIAQLRDTIRSGLAVLILHDLDLEGCILASHVKAVFPDALDLGISISEAEQGSLQLIEGAPRRIAESVARLLPPREAAWLAQGYRLEVFILEPDEIVERLAGGLARAVALATTPEGGQVGQEPRQDGDPAQSSRPSLGPAAS